jgi:hypothetical protein
MVEWRVASCLTLFFEEWRPHAEKEARRFSTV